MSDTIKGINYNDIELPDIVGSNIIGSNIRGGTINMGDDDKVLRFDKEYGLWMGNKEFASAPFSVDMDGNAVINSVTLSGYLQVGGAADDINDNETTINGGKITTNTITSTQIDTSGINIGDWAGDLDDIDDGSTYKKSTANQNTGGGRAYNALNTSDRYIKWLTSDQISEAISSHITNGVEIDSNGIRGYGSSSKTFEIDTSGNAYFAGEIGATSGYIGGTDDGWEISSGYIKSKSGKIELKGTTTSHIKAIKDSNNYIQITAEGGVPRLDSYSGGENIMSLRYNQLNFYGPSEKLAGNIEGSLLNTHGSLDFAAWNSAGSIAKTMSWTYDQGLLLGGYNVVNGGSAAFTKVNIDSPSGTTAALNVDGNFHLYTGSIDIKNTSASIAWGGVAMLTDGGEDNLEVLKPLSVPQLSSAPSDVPNGTIYYDTTAGQLKGKAGGSWYTL